MKKVILILFVMLLVLSSCGTNTSSENAEKMFNSAEDLFKPNHIEGKKPEAVVDGLSTLFVKKQESEKSAFFDASNVELYGYKLREAKTEWSESVDKVEYTSQKFACDNYETAIGFVKSLKTMSDSVSKIIKSKPEYKGWDFDAPRYDFEKTAQEARKDLIRLAVLNTKDDPLTISAKWENDRYISLIINMQQAEFVFGYSRSK